MVRFFHHLWKPPRQFSNVKKMTEIVSEYTSRYMTTQESVRLDVEKYFGVDASSYMSEYESAQISRFMSKYLSESVQKICQTLVRIHVRIHVRLHSRCVKIHGNIMPQKMSGQNVTTRERRYRAPGCFRGVVMDFPLELWLQMRLRAFFFHSKIYFQSVVTTASWRRYKTMCRA